MKELVCSRQLQIVLICFSVFAALIFLASSKFQHVVSDLRELPSHSLCNREKPSRCKFPLVYNKPPKTASTKIRDDLAKWSSTVKRRVSRCSPFALQAIFQMQECIPEDKSGCAIIATHLILSNSVNELFKSRIGDYKLLTSTRNPLDRIFSSFLQVSRTRAVKVLHNSTLLNQFLAQFNPWDLYNYHTGEGREGSCPLSLQEVAVITNLVNRADIVIDADLKNISNAILDYNNLFQLTDSVKNRRTEEQANVTHIDKNSQDMIKSVSCVEDEMHRMYRLRMASLYQKATKTPCLSNTRYPYPTCF